MSTCFLIGSHLSPDTLSPLLDEAIERHIAEYGVTEFVVGRYGRFDQLAAEALRRAKERHPGIRLRLLIPYHPAQRPVDIPPGFDDLLPGGDGDCPQAAGHPPGRSDRSGGERVSHRQPGIRGLPDHHGLRPPPGEAGPDPGDPAEGPVTLPILHSAFLHSAFLLTLSSR